MRKIENDLLKILTEKGSIKLELLQGLNFHQEMKVHVLHTQIATINCYVNATFPLQNEK